MKAEEKIFFAGKLLELIQQIEALVIDYCRVITANDDGHLLEKDDYGNTPF